MINCYDVNRRRDLDLSFMQGWPCNKSSVSLQTHQAEAGSGKAFHGCNSHSTYNPVHLLHILPIFSFKWKDFYFTHSYANLDFLICLIECPEYLYGEGCQFECHCINGSKCDHNGVCYQSGCGRGWIGDTCNIRKYQH